MKDVDISLGRETGTNGNPSSLSRDLLSMTPSANSNDRYSESPGQLVYAVGRIGYEFVSHSRRDSIRHILPKGTQDHEETKHLPDYREEHLLKYASAIQWRLELDGGTPIYVIGPYGALARDIYKELWTFLNEEKRVAIPGMISGTARDRSGLALPVVIPELRGMYNWKTDALVKSFVSPESEEQSNDKAQEQRVSDFLGRVDYECHNLGREPKDRALNFVVTTVLKDEAGRDIRALVQGERDTENAAQGQNGNEKDEKKKEMALDTIKVDEKKKEIALDTIKVERSPIGRPGSDCWDVKLIFFYLHHKSQNVKIVYQFTIDVMDVVPALVGPMRSWPIPANS